MANRFWFHILILILFFALALVPACGDDDDEDNNTGDSVSDDDDDDDNDDDSSTLCNAQVTVAEAPSGNLLSRKISVTTDSGCALSGHLTANGEQGYAPSVPTESAEGADHEFMFYGLLEDTEFDYTLYMAGDPGSVVATGSFQTPELPEARPVIAKLEFDESADADDWFAVWMIDALTWGGTDSNFTVIYDRQGRIRFYHLNENDHSGWIQTLSNGEIAFGNNEAIMALDLDGETTDLFVVQPNDPYFVANHHQFYLEDYDDETPLVLYNQVGDGVECDLTTFTDSMIGDGVLALDATGEETWRWSIFDHADVIDPTEMEKANCNLRYWGPNYSYWTHFNSVAPVPDQDAVLVSSRNLMRLIKIDTNTGDILWQMGPDLSDFTWIGQPDESVEDYWFRVAHDAKYLSPTRILLFDNGMCRKYPLLCLLGPWSRALEIEIDETNMTVEKVWEHRVNFAANQGNVTRHENGNTLIGSGGAKQTIEVDPNGDEIFNMKFTEGTQRAVYYPALWNTEDPPSE